MEQGLLIESRLRQTPVSLRRGGIEARKHARHQCARRFLYSDLKPLLELGIAPDPHPEGPSSLPVEAPEDIRKELANDRREGLRKAAILKQLPRLTETTATCDIFLKTTGHTTQESHALRTCQDNAFVSAVRDGEAMASVLEAQRRDLWFDRAKAEHSDLGRESRMLDEAMRILRAHEEVATLPRKIHGRAGEGSDRDSDSADSSVATTPVGEASIQEGESIATSSATDPGTPLLASNAPEKYPDGCDSSASTSSRIEEVFERRKMMQRLTEAQELCTRAKTAATDLMFLADRADEESSKEERRLRHMQRAPSHAEEALFDIRVSQRRLWMAKNEAALQSRLRYQEAVEKLHRVQEEWGPALGVELSVASSPHTPHTASSTTASSLLEDFEGHGSMEASSETVLSGRGGMDNEAICLWVIGVVVNLSSETLSRAYYGCFSESALVPSSGWMAFDQDSTDITVHCVVPKKSRKGIPARVDTWMVDGAPFPEVNGRYMERGHHNGVPRYRNSNNIFLFRHKLNRSEELGITRQTCLPESELVGEDIESAATTADLSLGNEVSAKVATNFSRLVKTSLQTINLDREERVRLNHQRTARAVAKIDEQFQHQMNKASATLQEFDSADDSLGGEFPPASTVSSTRVEKNRDLAIMVASDSPKLTFQDHCDDGDRIIHCEKHGVPPLCRRWVARACPKRQIYCLCRHYFVSQPERDRMVAWREGRDSKAEIKILECIARRETLLSEVEKEAAACSSRFLSKTSTNVEHGDVVSLLSLLDQMRLESVRVVEAVCIWREDVQTTKTAPSSKPIPLESRPGGGRKHVDNKRNQVPEVLYEETSEMPRQKPGEKLQRRPGGADIMEEDGNPSDPNLTAINHDARSSSRGNDHVEGLGESSTRGGNEKTRDGKLRKGGGGRAGNPGEVRSRVDRAAKGKWVVTMMVPGRKLWGASPAMTSEYKRFRRSRQDPKVARDQLCLGVFTTKNVAIQAYDDALCREAVKQRSSVLRMPKKRIVTRTCGRHMAVQSDDTPLGRPCEQCAAEALNGGVEHSPPYIWNNSNYLLKMTNDLAFLAGVDVLVGWLGHAFELEENPFLLAPEGIDENMEEAVSATDATLPSRVGVKVHSLAPSTAPARSGPSQGGPLSEIVGAPFVRRALSLPENPRPISAGASSLGAPAVTTPRDAWVKGADGYETPGVHVIENNALYGGTEDLGGADGHMVTSGHDSSRRGSEGLPGMAWPMSMGATAGASLGHLEGRDARPVYGRMPRSDILPIKTLADRRSFGRPSTQTTKFANGVQEWRGETANEGRFILPLNASPGTVQTNLSIAPVGVGPGFESRVESGTSVKILDERRVEAALATLHKEQDIADAMAGLPPRERGTLAVAKNTQTTRVSDDRSCKRFGDTNDVALRGAGGTALAGDVSIKRYQAVGPQGSDAADRNAKGRRKRTREVLAVYKHRGAQLVLAQSREKHPFRTEGVFCRPDRGEWAGQVHMSVAAKKFVARRLLDKALERRNEQRGRVGKIMRRLVEQGQPIHRLDGPRLRGLLVKARKLGGDRLSIDIMETEAALRLFGSVEGSATVIQAMTRGALQREASKRDLALRRAAVRLKRITTAAAGTVAEEVVGDVLGKALRRATRFIRRPVTATVGVYQDGRRMIVSAVPLEERGFGGGAPKAATEWQLLCSACQGRSADRVRSCKKGADGAFRGVCTCATVRPAERIRLTAYDPITGEQVHMVVTEKLLLKYLRINRLGNDGRTASSTVTTRLVSAAAKLLPLPWDAVLGYGNPRTEAGATLRHLWEPCYEARRVEKLANFARVELDQLSKASNMAENVAYKAVSAAEATCAMHETRQMSSADIAGHHRDLFAQLSVACDKSREALAFSWRSVQQMENRDAEDWTQAWDAFENGNNWRQLVKRRRTDLAIASAIQAGFLAKQALFRARHDRGASACIANQEKAKADRLVSALARRIRMVDNLSDQAEMASGAAKQALKLLTTLSRPTVKAAGRLQTRLVIEDGRHDRPQWDALFREGMILETPDLSYIGSTESKRRFCVATIRRDARTGAVRVTAAGEDKAVDLLSVTMTATEVMGVVAEKVGGHRGKELVSPIVMEGAYAAIRRVQDARRKEVLQVLVDALKLDIYQNDLAIGKLFFLRRRTELTYNLLESLWHRDAIAKRSTGRGTEIIRQFRRLGAGWANVAVFETWGDLFFEAYDPAVACTMTLQASLREVLGCLWTDKPAAAAYLHAVTVGKFPKKLVRQILKSLDVLLPAEDNRWWRRQLEGETPHLALLSKNIAQKYRGPIWTEDRYTSGKPVAARVLVSVDGDFLVEMEPRRETGRHADGVEGSGSVFSPGMVLRLEVSTQELRTVFRGLGDTEAMVDEDGSMGEPGGMDSGWRLAPDRRVEICRYLLGHVALEEDRPMSTTGVQQRCLMAKEADANFREAYNSYKTWAAAINAPVDPEPLPEPLEVAGVQNGTSSQFSLVLRPDIGSDEHLLPIHEAPWTPDGRVWFHAKVSLLQDAAGGGNDSREISRASDTTRGNGSGPSKNKEGDNRQYVDECEAGFCVTLRPEGAVQRRLRFERQTSVEMAFEDELSRLVGFSVARLEKEETDRKRAVEEDQMSARLAAAMMPVKVRTQNRIEALLHKEHAQTMIWHAEDAKSARQAAWSILPLLTLEPHNGGDGCTLALATPHNGRSTYHIIQPLESRAVAESAPACTEISRSTPSRVRAGRGNTKVARDKGGKRSMQGREVGRSVMHGRGGRARAQPEAIRRVMPETGKAPFEHWYRGERPFECGSYTEERSPNNPPLHYPSNAPLHLVQQVVRLGDDAAIVRLVLEPSLCCHALHPTNLTGVTENASRSNSQHNEPCQVRCVVRAEAYLPRSSHTLTLRARVFGNSSETKLSTTNGRAVEGDTTEGETFVESLCQSRQRQRLVLKEHREAEAQRGVGELSAAIQEATLATQAPTRISSQRHNTRVEGNELKVNNAFSILLIRATVTVSVRRIDLGSGSWRDSIGELVGCPVGQELTSIRVGRRVVFALDPSCPAPFNLKAEKLLGIRVHGDIVWIQARAEDQVKALLEADRELTVRESETTSHLNGGWQERMAVMKSQSRRYAKVVKERARRLLPALSRSYFWAPTNTDDPAAAEVRCVLAGAWLSRHSELGDPFIGAAATGATSGILSDDDMVRPWHLAKELLRMHVAVCRVPLPACPVPCCRETRTRVLQHHDASTDDVGLLLEELDRCMLRHWEKNEHKRRSMQNRESLIEEEDELIEEGKRLISPRPSASSTGGEPRPFKRSMQALHRATASIGQPHPGASVALKMSLNANSGMDNDQLITGKGKTKHRDSRAASEKCQVGLGMVRLLVGPDGRDAVGRTVGVSPGQDVESVVLDGSSQTSGHSTSTRHVARWVMSRLKLDLRGNSDSANLNQVLSFDETHGTSAACISGTRFLLTVAQLVDGSLSVTGHDPLNCQNVSLWLRPSAMNLLCISDGLERGPAGTPVGSTVARHLLRNAARLLELTDVGGINAFSLAGSRDDEESLHSSTASLGDPQNRSVGSTDSLRQDDDSIGNQTSAYLDSFPSADLTGMECRIRRLEAGRKRAEGKRRVAGSLKLASEANRYRQMHLAGDASVLATATSAFQAMANRGTSYGRSAAVGLGQECMLELRNKITQEFSGDNSSMPPSTSAENTDNSRGNGDTEEKQLLESVIYRNGEVSTSRRKCSTTSRGGQPKSGATLDELLEVMAGLAKHAEERPMDLATFAEWWLGATSKAETELKNRFLNPMGSG